MPYNNNYNRSIAKQHLDNVKNLIHHQENTDQIFHMSGMPNIKQSTASKTGGAIPQYLNDDIKYGVNQGVRAVYADASQYGSNQDDNEKYMNGGSGFGEGSHMDTGFERTLGGSKLKGSKIFKKASLKLVKTDGEMEGAGKRRRGRPSKKELEGGNWLDYGRPSKKNLEGGNWLDYGRPSKKNIEGGNFFSDFGKGFMSVIKPVASVAKSVLKVIPDPRAQMAGQALEAVGAGKRGRGRPKKVLEGGTLLGLPTKVIKGRGRPRKVGGMGIDDNNIVGGHRLVPVANMKASYMAGFG